MKTSTILSLAILAPLSSFLALADTSTSVVSPNGTASPNSASVLTSTPPPGPVTNNAGQVVPPNSGTRATANSGSVLSAGSPGAGIYTNNAGQIVPPSVQPTGSRDGSATQRSPDTSDPASNAGK